MYKAPAFQLVELIIPPSAGANTPVYFQNQPQLQSVIGDRQVYLTAIETYNVYQLGRSPLTPGNAMAGNNDILNATLTLNVAGTLLYQQIPLAVLVRGFLDGSAAPAVNSHVWEPFGLADLWQVDWTKSYVQLISAPISVPPYSYVFGVYYYWSSQVAR